MKKKWLVPLHARVKQLNTAYLNGNQGKDLPEKDRVAFVKDAEELNERGAEVVSAKIKGDVLNAVTFDSLTQVDYFIVLDRLIKQGERTYMEERTMRRRAFFEGSVLVEDQCQTIYPLSLQERGERRTGNIVRDEQSSYNRRNAVRYAEQWWDDYNPAFVRFEDNCTNYVSQCLYAGGAPMTSKTAKQRGWWYENEKRMSLSWSVAHSFRWHLSGATTGLRGEEKKMARDLLPGDVICYDFNGNGKWNHCAIVIAKDANNEPLVNAQTINSRYRYWTYQNSPAYTEQIQYKFFHITV
ncbi:amidase domain-containing protein [Shouchella sp. JSM 1781072]|uniref:amidase domain-containing protein n=1 Tax=Bacillaceae TaxID=186817 RepID=UPI0020D0943B|nr:MULTISPECIES: amidase domain-containing protein [Bacillaceae]UTR07762.1 amidase domain-containing protein [Alkalihalobacillus sp. LMS6]